MKILKYLIIFLISLTIANNQIMAVEGVGNRPSNNKGTKNISANCAPGNSKAYIDLNNVNAIVGTNGGMWQLDNAAYEVPKGSGKHSLFAGGIWVAGVDIVGQLKVAARTFNASSGSTGDDYWPGPLVSSGPNLGNVSNEICAAYDRLWKVDRDMVTKFKAWYSADDETKEREYPGYQIPKALTDWPGNGPDFLEAVPEYDVFLAPYADMDGNGRYNVDGGDYPNYEFEATNACKFVPEREAKNLNNTSVTLYGDMTVWWVYNDKGNVHTQTEGTGIGMEIRGQAFAFSTNDELNNMTFYNYQIINRSTYVLNNTYFGVWVDADVGKPDDDCVGCDVNRGLGFAYNYVNTDGDGGSNTYGANPPAVGVDFFEGPYQDPSGEDKLSNWANHGDIVPDCQNGYRDILDEDGEIIGREKAGVGDIFNGNINGLNFGDQIADNERWGMRRYVYHVNLGSGPTSDPRTAMDHYNYLRGIWKDNSRMTYGGNGHNSSTLPAEFMFPGTSDECNWGTGGIPPPSSEKNWVMNEGLDARFLISSGPFILKPGATNYITIGVPWARNFSNPNAYAAVEVMKLADDKAQRLFENCFRMINGPDAPELTGIQLDQRFIFHLNNPPASNNYLERYREMDPFIPKEVDGKLNENLHYVFQGYQVFQLKDEFVTVNQIYDLAYSKLVFQCDIDDDITQLVNFTWDAEAEANVPQIMVKGENQGIRHTFEIYRDLFATTGSGLLVNYKKYHYVAIAYSSNIFKKYDQSDPTAINGQKTPYLASRKGVGGEIKKYTFVPQPSYYSQGGIEINSQFGDIPAMEYLSGRGNSFNYTDLEDETIAEIMKVENNWKAKSKKYKKNASPFEIKVVDPLNVIDGDFVCYIEPDSINIAGLIDFDYAENPFNTSEKFNHLSKGPNAGLLLNAKWAIVRNPNTENADTVFSHRWIRRGYEQLIPEWGIAVNIYQVNTPINQTPELTQDNAKLTTAATIKNNGLIGSSISYQNPLNRWYGGFPDFDGPWYLNWIRCGTYKASSTGQEFNDVEGDPTEEYEKILEGTWAPYRFVARIEYSPGNHNIDGSKVTYDIYRLPSINFVITKDDSKWTRCIVIETGEDYYPPGSTAATEALNNPITEGGAAKFMLRQAPSKDKKGNSAANSFEEAFEIWKEWHHKFTNPGQSPPENIFMDENKANFISPFGMSWFPGYAIDIETGERLNIAFGEDSYLIGENGRDMIWNPTGNMGGSFSPLFGGKHFVYVFVATEYEDNGIKADPFLPDIKTGIVPRYDYGKFLFEQFNRRYSREKNLQDETYINTNKFEDLIDLRGRIGVTMLNAQWVTIPRVEYRNTWKTYAQMPNNEVTIKIRISNPYYKNMNVFQSDFEDSVNKGFPYVKFNLNNMASKKNEPKVLSNILDKINVVPNPYNAYSSYEKTQLDRVIKITNLPRDCQIKIFNVGGTLIKSFDKSNDLTWIDWNLTNSSDIPIAGGVYIIHVSVPGVGEKILKWFGVIRPFDISAF